MIFHQQTSSTNSHQQPWFSSLHPGKYLWGNNKRCDDDDDNNNNAEDGRDGRGGGGGDDDDDDGSLAEDFPEKVARQPGRLGDALRWQLSTKGSAVVGAGGRCFRIVPKPQGVGGVTSVELAIPRVRRRRLNTSA